MQYRLSLCLVFALLTACNDGGDADATQRSVEPGPGARALPAPSTDEPADGVSAPRPDSDSESTGTESAGTESTGIEGPKANQPPADDPADERGSDADEPDVALDLDLDPLEVLGTVLHVADKQIETPIDRDPRHWSMAPLYAGLIDASLATGDARYLAAVLRTGMRIEFELGSRKYHADGHAAGHSWIRLFLMDPERDPVRLAKIIERFTIVVENPIVDDLSFTKPPPPGRYKTDRWTWADSLYMSPPTLAALWKATGDDRYLAFMDDEYLFAYQKLFDSKAKLFYRDETYIPERTPTGRKVFWARGNGWVYAGLALMLELLPDDYPTRSFYEALFLELSGSLLDAQQPDGFWYPSLLDAEHAPIGETSATAFFVFGMTWGMRSGLLDSEHYAPAVERGWDALASVIDADGTVTSVQPFGERPELFDASSSVAYGTGALLMAGAEILRALDAAAEPAPAEFLAAAEALVPETLDLSASCKWFCAW